MVRDELALADVQVQVSEGGARGMRVRVLLPPARSAVENVERTLSAYLFEAAVAVA